MSNWEEMEKSCHFFHDTKTQAREEWMCSPRTSQGIKEGNSQTFASPLSMTGKFLAFAIKSRSWCVVVVPQIQASWFHLTETNRREILPLAKKGQQGKLLKFRNNALRPFCSKYDMLAIELDFR